MLHPPRFRPLPNVIRHVQVGEAFGHVRIGAGLLRRKPLRQFTFFGRPKKGVVQLADGLKVLFRAHHRPSCVSRARMASRSMQYCSSAMC